MSLSCTLVSSLLFVFAVLAAYDGWAGGVYERDPGIPVNYARGTFTVPTLSDDSPVGSGVVIGIGLDGGQTCEDSFFSAGINMMKTDYGVDIKAWGEFWPYVMLWIPQSFTISSGHRLTISVTANSSTIATFSIENHDNTGTGPWSDTLTSINTPLCRRNAVWVVGVIPEPDGQSMTPLANFGQVTFSSRLIRAPGLDAVPHFFMTLFNIQQGEQTLTVVRKQPYTADLVITYNG